MSSLAEGFIDMAIIILGERKRFSFFVGFVFVRAGSGELCCPQAVYLFFFWNTKDKSKRQKHQPL
jgi:hypothetical protein